MNAKPRYALVLAVIAMAGCSSSDAAPAPIDGGDALIDVGHDAVGEAEAGDALACQKVGEPCDPSDPHSATLEFCCSRVCVQDGLTMLATCEARDDAGSD